MYLRIQYKKLLKKFEKGKIVDPKWEYYHAISFLNRIDGDPNAECYSRMRRESFDASIMSLNGDGACQLVPSAEQEERLPSPSPSGTDVVHLSPDPPKDQKRATLMNN